MRVIAGQFRSRQLVAPRGMATRPTSDRLRETLFNVLGPRLPGARFVDLYAGSGAVGIEALSRGATFCIFVEHAPPAVVAIRENLRALKIGEGFALETRPAARAIAELTAKLQPFDVIFLDPPYEAAAEYQSSMHALATGHTALLSATGLVVAEHARRTPLPEIFGVLSRTRLLEQGDAALSFYAVEPGLR